MYKLFGLFLFILLISGCATVLNFDEPDSSQYNTVYSDINYKLKVVDEKNVGRVYIHNDGQTGWTKADKPIEEYYYKSLSEVLNAIGLRDIGKANIEILAEIVDVSIMWNSGVNVPVRAVIETNLTISDSVSNKIMYKENFVNSYEKNSWGGGLPAYGVAKEVIEKVVNDQMADIAHNVDFSSFRVFEIERADTPTEEMSVVRDLNMKDTEKIDKSEFPIVTVFDFEYEGISEMEATFLVDFLGGALFDTGKYRIIDRAQREAILSEIQFSMTGCTDESCQLEAGKLLAADYMVIGSLGKVGSRFVINAKLIDVEIGETVLSARDIYPNVDAMLDGCDKLAVQLSLNN